MALIRERHLVRLEREVDVYIARELAARLAEQTGFDAYRCSDIETAVSELCVNALKYGRRGWASLRIDHDSFEAVITDEGPGFEAPPSAPSGLGMGLAGVGRLMDQLLIETLPGGGRVTTSKRLPATRSADRGTDRWWVEVVSRARIGNSESGDRWWVQNGGVSLLLAVVDGLGSGPGAANASKEVVESLSRQDADRPLDEIMGRSHRSAAPTRGAVAILARLRPDDETLEYVSVGDITGRVEPSGERLVPTPGVLGVELPRLEVSRIPWTGESRLSIWTDGITQTYESRFDGPDDRDRRGDWIETVTREHGLERDDCLLLTAGETGTSP